MFVPLCRTCGNELRPYDEFCPNCGQPRRGTKATFPPTDRGGVPVGPNPADRTGPIPEAERSRLLEEAIGRYVSWGFHVRLRTPTSAQLVKPKQFSFVWALLWFLLFGVGLLVYVFYYAAKKDVGVYLHVDDHGNTTVTRQPG